MKKLISIVTVILFIASSYCQAEERFKIKGTAKLIAVWDGETLNDALGTLASGDKISIATREEVGVYVNVVRNNVTKQLVAIEGSEEVLEKTVIKVYEYDFDSDGQKELIVVHSPEFSITTVEVFRYSGGLVERVGNFSGEIDILLDKNTIHLPYGSQGLSNGYHYRDGAFFELIYHDPNKKTK